MFTFPFALQSGVAFINEFSMDFDGSDEYVDCGSIADFDYQDPFSLAAWVKLTANSFHAILSKQSVKVGSTSRGWVFYFDGGKLKLIHRNAIGNEAWIESQSTYNDGDWHFVVATYDGSESAATGMKIYVDGSSVVTTTIEDTLSATTQIGINCKIGVRDTNLYFDGKIDEPAIYDRELSSGDVTALYSDTVPKDISTTSPYAWWRFTQADKDGFATILDHSGNARNGTAVNMESSDINVDVP